MFRDGLRILDIGSGGVSSVKGKPGDEIVEVDPAFSGNKRALIKGVTRRRVTDVGAVKGFQPHLVAAVAPNPNDVDGGMLFEYEEQIRGANAVVAVIENRTREAQSAGGAGRVAMTIAKQLREMGRRDVRIEEYEPDCLSEVLQGLGIDRVTREERSRNLGGGRGAKVVVSGRR